MIFFVLSVICFAALLYPYIIYPITLRFFSVAPAVERSFDTDLTYAMLFSAYNEESCLPRKIENLRNLKKKHINLEIFAYSDQSSDRTLEILQENSDVLTAIGGDVRQGKATGMKKLVAMTGADILIFTDANVLLKSDAISNLISYFADKSIGSVAGSLHLSNPGTMSDSASVGSLYWRMEERLKRLETSSGSTMGADGSLFAIRRELYPEVPADLLDDMIASFTPVIKGKRCISVLDVVAMEDVTQSSKEEFSRKRRIGCRAYSTYRYLKRDIKRLSFTDRYKFVSHKLLRWYGALFLMLSNIFFILCIWQLTNFYSTFIGFVFVASLVAACIKLKLPYTEKLVAIVSQILATGLGVIDSLRGKTYQTWVPPTRLQ